MMVEMQVVFPAPLRPNNANTPPGGNEKLTVQNMAVAVIGMYVCKAECVRRQDRPRAFVHPQ